MKNTCNLCRAYLSDYFDPETKEVVYEGRFNGGAIAMHIPMYIMKAREEGKDFYEVLDYYLEMIREVHKKTYQHIGKMKASSNPLGFMEGGFYGGNLKADDDILPILKSMTMSFGVTALNESSILMTGKTIKEDPSFAHEVLDYLNAKISKFKEEDGILYALYGVPAESLCHTQIQQFRNKYGIIENVSDREYFTNSFHMHVTEDITPIEKQDLECDLFHKCTGGHIGYGRITDPTNFAGLKATIKRAIKKGFYYGVNFPASKCEKCGHESHDMGETCPKCGSDDITTFDRITGYLGYSKIQGDHTINKGMMANVKDRKSM